jgi:hypothetical protein
MTKVISRGGRQCGGSTADDQEDDPDGRVEEGVRVEESDSARDVRLPGSEEVKEDKFCDAGDDQEYADAL